MALLFYFVLLYCNMVGSEPSVCNDVDGIQDSIDRLSKLSVYLQNLIHLKYLSPNSTLMIYMIFVRLPKCEPMDTIVKVELGEQVPQVEEIIPSHIVVPRCSGLHTWKCGFNADENTHNNKAKKCVSSSETSQELQVSS